MGEIRHISIMPEPRYCPVLIKNKRSGIPNSNVSNRNWTMKMGPNSIERIAKRLILNIPRVQLKHAKRKLKLWGHLRIWNNITDWFTLISTSDIKNGQIQHIEFSIVKWSTWHFVASSSGPSSVSVIVEDAFVRLELTPELWLLEVALALGKL